MSIEADHRLPRTVLPHHYHLRIEPDFSDYSLKGLAVVQVNVQQPLVEIVLNSVDIDVDQATVVAADGSSQEAAVSYDPGRERISLTVGRALDPGPAEIRIGYTGEISDNLQGFYRSRYTDSKGDEQVIASTQFEATDARRAFPCWDEPDLKATYDVTLVVPDHMMAVSNSPVLRESQLEGGRRAVEFSTTMKMSTYLVAFIVGDLEATDPVDVGGTPLRVIHLPGKANLTQFALEAGTFALQYFADYYGIDYPGDKLDMIGIPDFAWGAMENLGAVTYREADLLVDPVTATQGELSRVADVISHEISHMWFGDLVTMKWWNGLWLNEAFASMMELKCVDAFRPAWKRWLSFAPTRNLAMDTDSLKATRPIEIPVGPPEEANAMFDVLTYSKGSAVLRMLEVYLGEDVFRDGVRLYLKRFAYGNTETSDLWEALEEVSGRPVGDIMHAWIFQGGYPRLDVVRSATGYEVSQEQFRFIGEGTNTWQVPALYGSDTGDGCQLIGDRCTIEAGDRFLLNRRGQGFYRVRYSPDLFRELTARAQSLSASERYAVVSDVWANVVAGDSAAADFISLVSGFTEESEPAVWKAIVSGLSELDHIISNGDRHRLQAFVRNLIGNATDRVGWLARDSDSDLQRQFRGLLLHTRGVLGHDTELESDARSFVMATTGRDAVDGDVAAAALGIVAAHGDEAEFAEFVAAYRKAKTPQEEVRFLRAAIAVPNENTASQVLDMAIAGDIRRQDVAWVTARLIGHRTTGAASWGRVTENWDEVLDSMAPQIQRRMLDLIPARSEPHMAADIANWLGSHPMSGASKFVDQQLELLAANVALRSREATRLAESL